MGNNTPAKTEEAAENKPAEPVAYTPPATQADLDRIIADRLSRERAKYGDYQELKSKAAQFDELTEAQKTELQKAIDRAEKAEAALAKAEQANQVRTWSQEIGKATGVPAELLRGATREELQAHADALKAAGVGTPNGQQGSYPVVTTDGKQTEGKPTTPADKFAEFMKLRS